MNSQVNKLAIISLPKILDARGNLTFIQNYHQIPFEIKRAFFTYSVPGGEMRGGHAYKEQDEIIIALSGSFDIIIPFSNGEIQKFTLNRPYFGLYIPSKTWRHMENFSSNSFSLHLSNRAYCEDDYLRDFDAFKNGEY